MRVLGNITSVRSAGVHELPSGYVAPHNVTIAVGFTKLTLENVLASYTRDTVDFWVAPPAGAKIEVAYPYNE